MGRMIFICVSLYLGVLFIHPLQAGQWKRLPIAIRRPMNTFAAQGNVLYISAGDNIYRYKGAELDKCVRLRGHNPAANQVYLAKGNIYVATEYGLFKGLCGLRLERVFKPQGKAVYSIEMIAGKIFVGTNEGIFQINENTSGMRAVKIVSTNSRVISLKGIVSKGMLFALAEDKILGIDLLSNRVLLEKQLGVKRQENPWQSSSHLFALRGNTLFVAYRSYIYSIALKDKPALNNVIDTGHLIKAIALFNDGLIILSENTVYRYSAAAGNLNAFSEGISSAEFADLINCEGDVFLLAENSIYKFSDILLAGNGRFEISDVYNYLSFEPDILTLQKKAMETADVLPEKIEQWKSALKRRPLMPQVSLDMGGDNNRSISDTMSVCCSGSYGIGPDDKTMTKNLDWKVSVEWDLRDLIWDPEVTSVDVRSKLTSELRDDILDDLDQLYYERRRQQIRLLTSPPKAMPEAFNVLTKLEKLRADIDGMTNGFLSKYLKANGHYNWELEFIRRILYEKGGKK